MQNSKSVDRKGNPVTTGDIVRIVSFSDEFIQQFPKDEQMLISTMVGKFFKVYGIDEMGQPWVNREWYDENGILQSHVIALDPPDMELI